MIEEITDQQKGERVFQNIQRVLSDSSSTQLTIINWSLGLVTGGFIGVFSIESSTLIEKKCFFHMLSVFVLLGLLYLWVLWTREDKIASDFQKKNEAFVGKQKKDKWTRRSANIWVSFYITNLILWLIFLFHVTSNKFNGIK